MTQHQHHHTTTDKYDDLASYRRRRQQDRRSERKLRLVNRNWDLTVEAQSREEGTRGN